MLPNPVRVPQLLPIRLLQRYAVDKYTYVVMSTPVDLPRLVLLAQGFAMCAHRNRRRKYEDLPYVVHCERVARTVAEYTDDAKKQQLISGLIIGVMSTYIYDHTLAKRDKIEVKVDDNEVIIVQGNDP